MQEGGAGGLRAEAEAGAPHHQQVELLLGVQPLPLTFSIPRNLHSHHFSSPLTNQQEVSAFGESGEGDTGDVWKVMVVIEKWNKTIKKVVCDTDYWQRDQVVQFKHVDTGVYLGSSGQTFGRPISGQMEIIGISRPDGSTKWRTQEV